MRIYTKSLRQLASIVIAVLVMCIGLSMIPANIVHADPLTGKIVNVVTSVNLRQRASNQSAVVKELPLGTPITIEQSVAADADDASGYKTWYKVSCTLDGQTYQGFIATHFVKQDAQNAVIVNVTTSVNMRERASNNSNLLAVIPLGTAITVEQSVSAAADNTSAYKTWYKVNYNANGTVLTGFIADHFVQITPATAPAEPTPIPTPVAPTSAPPPTQYVPTTTYEQEIGKFPASYQTYLAELHLKHPNWVFIAENCTKTWDEVLNLETRSGCSLVQNTVDDSWKSKAPGHYDPVTKKYTVIDSPNWVNASRPCVAYYLDPRNSLTEDTIFQFLDLSYNKSAIAESPDNYVGKVLDGTFMGGTNGVYAGASISYSQIVAIAGYESSINPVFLAARIIQEVGTNGSSSSNGKTGYYNFYNIGAYSDATNAAYVGLKFAQYGNGVENSDFNKAYQIPWTTQGASIVGGAKWIGANYTTKGQNSIYYMRFNTSPTTTTKIGYHQYMTATTSPTAEAKRMFNAYSKSGLLENPLTFIIPVYTGMPETACPVPTTSVDAGEFSDIVFKTLLGRTASKEEISWLTDKIVNSSAASAVAEIINSSEFQGKKYDAATQATLIYKVFTGIENPDENLIKFYADTYNSGYSMMHVYEMILNSSEAQINMAKYSFLCGTYISSDVIDYNMKYAPFIASLYSGFLGREYERDGMRYWITFLANKTKSGQQIALEFYQSTEFQGLTLTNEEFITRLYNVCLGRAPEAQGLQYWLEELNVNHKSREFVFAGFVNSTEFNTKCTNSGISNTVCGYTNAYELGYDPAKKSDAFVARLYRHALGREPEQLGFNYWTNNLANGMSGKEVANGFITSTEFINMNLNNEQFVDKMYMIFLGREAEAAGKAYWLDILNNGYDRNYVFEGFVVSNEFVALCKDAGIKPN